MEDIRDWGRILALLVVYQQVPLTSTTTLKTVSWRITHRFSDVGRGLRTSPETKCQRLL